MPLQSENLSRYGIIHHHFFFETVMATLLTLRNMTLGYSGPLLLDGVDLTIRQGERVTLIGRNGEGKSTLLKVISGLIQADSGERQVVQNAVIAYMPQDIPADLHGTVFEIVSQGLEGLADVILAYHQATLMVMEDPGEKNLDYLARAQQALEDADGWQLEQQVESTLSRLSLESEQETQFSALSGGLKRRVLLARELVKKPQLLLLDEPTNHLDIESIQWLEKFLKSWSGSLLFITHDRAFMQNLATRILELDRGSLTDWPEDYQNYLRRREERANAEAKENERFDKRLSQEEVWIRQGVKARRTRNEGRVRQLEAMREKFRQRRSVQGKVRINMQQAERSGKLVAEVDNISYSWDGEPVIRDFSTTIMRGDKIGIIGPNGCGKSTLLNLLLGKLEPQSGDVKIGTGLEVAYFDQLRASLDLDKTVQENVGEGSDRVEINGHSRHIISYLQDFLFAPERVRQPLNSLSGGERNRVLLAKLFTRPANLLVLDEPTNDLDVETLELLEELLINFEGTVLLVSHDRAFLDNVVTSTYVFTGGGIIDEAVGGYQDWLREQRAAKSIEGTEKITNKPLVKHQKPAVETKVSYKIQRELEQLPKEIELLENKIKNIHEELAKPEIYTDRQAEVAVIQQQLARSQTQLETLYSRWEELEP
jgi:ATP-binding cassette subfamily F protein uup